MLRWLRAVLGASAGAPATFHINVMGDEEMTALSRQFRGLDETTDVLSFGGEMTPEGRHLGDVAISLEQARRQAVGRGASVAGEVQILILHGVLHCLGHDHETDEGEMDALEDELRRRFIDPRIPWSLFG